MADLPREKSLTDVVDELRTLNQQQEYIQESVAYTQELTEYIEREGHNLEASQLAALEDLILTLKEGRLDDLEAEQEQILRDRIEAKKDDERNDLLEKISKFTGISMDILKDEFAGKDRSLIMAILIRTALIGLFKGFLVGAFLEPFKLIGKGLVAVSSKIGKFLGLDIFYKNLKIGLQTNITKAFNFLKVAFATRPGQPPGFLAKSFGGLKKLFIDVFNILKVSFGNVVKILSAVTGFIAGRIGALESLTQLEFKVDVKSWFFKRVAGIINFILEPIKKLGNILFKIFTPAIRGLNKAGKAIAPGSEIISKLGSNIVRFFSALQPVQKAFTVLRSIGGTFFKIGKVFGRFFYVVSGIWGAITGFMKGWKRYEDGNLFEKLLGGIAGAFTGIVNILITSLLDLVKDGISWVANKLGFENFSNFLDSFSFEEMFTNLINRITDTIVNTFRTIGDLIQDIGVSGIIRNVTLSLLKIMKKIAMFPVAVAAGGAAALGALLPGGKTPQEAFSETFASVLNFGDDLIDGLKAQADGLNSEGELIDARSEEGIRLRDQRELERGEGPAISQAIYNTQQRAGDVVNYVQSSFDTVRSTAGGVLANVYE